ncbi:MAG TPA: L-ribulose-5-phosphate 4-epimerase AraD [Chthoniobacteraceae bacterium]|jgi:L-ribulose-5-phosphate 4-epimerase|nr:L-ribulose-5-phosphate 4-epimerase AraD [Chthoniobacteraceae bacterium]
MSSHQDIREECCAANVQLPALGLVDLTFGNVSVADPRAGVFAIKPSGVGYQGLTPEQMVIVDYEGNIVEGALRPSSDTPTHRRLFMAFPEVRAVVHTHSRAALAFAQAGRGIPCLGTTHADYFYGEIPVTRHLTPEEIAAGYEWETGNIIVERFKTLDPVQMSAVLVHSHGPFAWGSTGAKAVENALALEIVAEMARHTLHLSPQMPPIPRALMDKHFFRKHGAGAYYGQAK